MPLLLDENLKLENSSPKNPELQPKPAEIPAPKPIIPTATAPLAIKKGSSKFSITESLAPSKEELKEKIPEAEASLPVSHFTETDLASEWQKFLSDLKKNDIVKYSAINGFRLKKINEEAIEVGYPSDSSKVEFDKVSPEFLNHFRHKVNNFKVNFTFKMDVALKKEVVTKRKLFDKLAEINPVLNDLNDLMKFDFS